MAKNFASREEISAQQLKTLRQLFRAILPANSFYAKKFSGIKTGFSGLEEFSDAIPFTTKAELVADQENHPPFGSNLTFPLETYTRFHQTSGTTGAPLRWLDTPATWQSMAENWAEIFRAAGVGAGDKIYFAFSFGPFIGFWLAFDAAQQIGALCLPGGGLGSEGRLKAILENEITVLCCTPTYALRLGEVAARENISLAKSRVKKIIVAGEPGGGIPATRQRIENFWRGAKVFDHHGMTETGPVTYESPGQPGDLRVLESAFIAEIIDPKNGKQLPRGQTGELVLTTLQRVGSPVLRYRTGDLARAKKTAGELILAGGILGRVDDMIIVRGVNIHPSAVEKILLECGEIAEFRAVVRSQNSLMELSLEIEPTRACRNISALAAQIGKKLHATFNLRIPVRTVAPQTLPRFEMKARRWVRE